MRSALNTLQEKLDVFDKMKGSFESTVEHIKVSFFVFFFLNESSIR